MTLMALTAALAIAIGVPMTWIAGADAASMMALGASLGLAIVLGGYFCVRAFMRGPSHFQGITMMVGGFFARLLLFFLALAILVTTTDLEPSRFLLWTIGFYFVLVMAEAWMLARPALHAEGESPR